MLCIYKWARARVCVLRSFLYHIYQIHINIKLCMKDTRTFVDDSNWITYSRMYTKKRAMGRRRQPRRVAWADTDVCMHAVRYAKQTKSEKKKKKTSKSIACWIVSKYINVNRYWFRHFQTRIDMAKFSIHPPQPIPKPAPYNSLFNS